MHEEGRIVVRASLWNAIREAVANIAFPGEGEDPKVLGRLALEAMKEVDNEIE